MRVPWPTLGGVCRDASPTATPAAPVAAAAGVNRGRGSGVRYARRVLLNAVQFLGGLVLLLVGGRLLVTASIDTAKRLDVSPLVVGLTLVAWGTSAPELALNLISAIKGRGGLALGNVVGANICNMGLVLGACALVHPLAVQQRLIKVEIWLNAAILVFMAVLGMMSGFARWESGLMLGVFGGYSVWTIMAALRVSARARTPAGADPLGGDPMLPKGPMSWTMIGTCFLGGLALLSIGGSVASDGAVGIAVALGVPNAVVGVTIVSLGTTLPELVTGIMAVRKGQTDLAVGNVLGSCLFNAGAIFGLTSLIQPPPIETPIVVPLWTMGLLAVLLVPISRTFDKTVSRREGAMLLGLYAAFLGVAAWMATA